MPPSSRNGVRKPVGPAASAGRAGVPLASSPGGPSSRAAPSGSRIALAASAEARWRAWAAPATVAAVWISSPANGPEEPPPAEVDRGRAAAWRRDGAARRRRPVGECRSIAGHARPLCVGRLARPGIAGGVGQSGDLDA